MCVLQKSKIVSLLVNRYRMETLGRKDHVKVIVHLTGGLGNQLFQIAAALSLKPNQITLMTVYGDPRGVDQE